jgi:hypothetical protein
MLFFNNEKSGQSSHIDNIFTSCVHYYENFTLVPKEGDREYNKINWYITGGGGGELARSFDSNRLNYSKNLYNKRLSNENKNIENSGSQTRSIEITGNKVQIDYHFLIVHVKGGEVVEVYPQFVEKKKVHIRRSTVFTNVKYTTTTFASPIAFGNMMSFDFFQMGFEKVVPGLYFLTWEPGTGFGSLLMNPLGDMTSATISTFEWLKFGLHFPRSLYTISLLGGMTIHNKKNVSRNFVSYGIEAPILYNFFGIGGVGKKLSLRIYFYNPTDVREGFDPHFGNNIKSSVSFVYTF